MGTIKIEISVEAGNENLLKSLSVLLGDAKNLTVNAPEEVKAEPAKKPAAKPKKAPEPVIEEEEDNDDLLGEDAEETDKVSIEDLKAMLAKKVTTHRDKIVTKLKALGATKLSDLDEEHFQTLHDFMDKLK